MASTIPVTFEDAQPFKGADWPITFRVNVRFNDVTDWTWEDWTAFEIPGEQRDTWVAVPPHHPVRPILFDFATSDAGHERIENAIFEEMASTVDDGLEAFKHRREYKAA